MNEIISTDIYVYKSMAVFAVVTTIRVAILCVGDAAAVIHSASTYFNLIEPIFNIPFILEIMIIIIMIL